MKSRTALPILLVPLAALTVTAAATVGAGTIFAAPAKAAISCPNGFVPPSVSPDCYFVYMMARDNIQANSQADLISAAHDSCAQMAADTGSDPVIDDVPILQRANPALTLPKAAIFANIAAAAYCPSVIRR
jgi:hypothetical protein